MGNLYYVLTTVLCCLVDKVNRQLSGSQQEVGLSLYRPYSSDILSSAICCLYINFLLDGTLTDLQSSH